MNPNHEPPHRDILNIKNLSQRKTSKLKIFALSILTVIAIGLYLTNHLWLRLVNVEPVVKISTRPYPNETAQKIVEAARSQIGVTKNYDSGYKTLDYPNGDVPRETGVCTDVIIRALRDTQNGDLQELIHKDMTKNFSDYPNLWNLEKPDANIDHRRVPNILKYYERMGKTLPITQNGEDYLPGDIITWNFPQNQHIGIVSNKILSDGTPLIIHNMGRGTEESDVLFQGNLVFKPEITGHIRIW